MEILKHIVYDNSGSLFPPNRDPKSYFGRFLLWKLAVDLPDNTVCHVDDISIPHTWRTIESHNNKFYIIFKMRYLSGGGTDMTVEYNYGPYVLTLLEGNYTGANLASGIQELLNGFASTFDFGVLYHPARGTTTIEAKPEGMDSHNNSIYPVTLE